VSLAHVIPASYGQQSDVANPTAGGCTRKYLSDICNI
jgi:hypothetical protein